MISDKILPLRYQIHIRHLEQARNNLERAKFVFNQYNTQIQAKRTSPAFLEKLNKLEELQTQHDNVPNVYPAEESENIHKELEDLENKISNLNAEIYSLEYSANSELLENLNKEIEACIKAFEIMENALLEFEKPFLELDVKHLITQATEI